MAASFEKDLDRAESEIDIAISLNPTFALAHNLRGTTRSYSGNPLEAIPEIEQAIRLDPALSQQYLHYLGNLAHGDFGPSLKYRNHTVTDVIAQALPVSLMLGALAFGFALGVGIPVGY